MDSGFLSTSPRRTHISTQHGCSQFHLDVWARNRHPVSSRSQQICKRRYHSCNNVLKTTVQLVFEYKVGKYVFGRENTPSTYIVLNMDSNHSKLYCTCVRHAICLVSCSRMQDLGVLKTTVQSVVEYKVGKYVILILGGVEYVR